MVAREQVQQLYEAGQDVVGEEALLQVEDRERMAMCLLAIARRRLAIITSRMSETAQYAHCLAAIDPDIAHWIGACMADDGERFRSPLPLLPQLTVGRNIATEPEPLVPPSLSATCTLLHRVVPMLPRGSVQHKRAMELSEAASALLQAAREG